MLVGRKFVGRGRECGDDLVVFADDEGDTLNKVMIDVAPRTSFMPAFGLAAVRS
jgi:hypothetical protein